MNTQRIRPWLLTLSCLFIFVGCAKRPCGEPLPETPASITGTQWKLTRSNDAGVNNILTPFTFSVFTFGTGDGNGFDGTIQRAKYNVLQDVEKAQRFYYEVPRPGSLSIEFLNMPSAKFQEEEAVVKDYYYELSRQGLEMQDAATGAVYTFCPYTGGEAPDTVFD